MITWRERLVTPMFAAFSANNCFWQVYNPTSATLHTTESVNAAKAAMPAPAKAYVAALFVPDPVQVAFGLADQALQSLTPAQRREYYVASLAAISNEPGSEDDA